ncbi:hypothetical protein [Photobacterium satsumensis]|uniref:hypothetical protein n=1 Tax=Photobacterium satsumensis TaxID=2910239 RepID=UPI003D0F5A1B
MELNKYQFFITGESDGANFTLLDMQASDFQESKNALLSQGFFVDGEIVLAKSAQEAVVKYKKEHAKVVRGGLAPAHQFYSFFAMLGDRLRKKKR